MTDLSTGIAEAARTTPALLPRWLHMTAPHQLTLTEARQRVAESSPTTPLRVLVCGLPGVGSTTVAAALAALGRFEIIEHVPGTEGGDVEVVVRVVAETVRPEDLRAIAAAGVPALVLLTKADTCGLGPGGPVETARRRCAELASLAAAAAEPIAGLVARAALDPTVLDRGVMEAIGVLAAEAADLRTAETFVCGPHSLSVAMRRRLLDALDLFGIAHAVVVARRHDGVTAGEVRRVLRRVSAVDAVAARIAQLGADERYRRLQAVIAGLDAAAISDRRIADFLTGDDVVLARMAAAREVMQAFDVRTSDETPVARARYWRRYGAGPVGAVHRACAADLVNGSLRLWGGPG